MDQRKLMTMHKALRPRDDINSLYVSKKKKKKKKEEDLPAFNIVLMHRCNDKKTI